LLLAGKGLGPGTDGRFMGKKMGLIVTSIKREDGARVYSIARGEA
jgi:hypothetical protein